jgi:hypothetical protein
MTFLVHKHVHCAKQRFVPHKPLSTSALTHCPNKEQRIIKLSHYAFGTPTLQSAQVLLGQLFLYQLIKLYTPQNPRERPTYTLLNCYVETLEHDHKVHHRIYKIQRRSL